MNIVQAARSFLLRLFSRDRPHISTHAAGELTEEPITPSQTRSALSAICDIPDDPVVSRKYYITRAQMRRILLRRLPLELVDIILQWAYSVDLVHRVSHYNIVQSSMPILTMYLGEAKSQYITRVSVHIRGSISQVDEQAPSPGPGALYTLETVDIHSVDPSLPTNARSSSHPIEPHSYDFFWDRESDVVRGTKEARRVILWAHARYPGWVNNVEEASLVVSLYPF